MINKRPDIFNKRPDIFKKKLVKNHVIMCINVKKNNARLKRAR